jgi:transcriptional regulator with XRE-family HTH domain
MNTPSEKPRGRPNVDAAELARRVRAKREAEKLSLREAGEALDMSAATLSRVEAGKLPERDRLLRLAAWAGMSLDPASRAARNRAVHGDDASTVEAVELHLRADKNLDPEDAETLVQLMRTAYDRMSKRK